MADGRGGKRAGAGRPKGSRSAAAKERMATITDLAKAHTEVAIGALVEIAKEGSDAARVSAATALLDRAYGKPAQFIETEQKVRNIISDEPMTEEEWAKTHAE